VRSADESKEDLAHSIARRDGINSGLVCVVTAVEPCWSYALFRDRDGQRLRLVPRMRKCLFIYHYRIHPVFGFLNARIQTWFPFQIQICLNGRVRHEALLIPSGDERAPPSGCRGSLAKLRAA